MIEFKQIDHANNLPTDWDEQTVSYFQGKEYLIHAQEFNPCKQRYYLKFKEGNFIAGAIVYSLRLDLLTYLKLKSPIKMNIVGIPSSVSSAGIFGEPRAMEQLKEYIYKTERGFLLMLNLNNKSEDRKISSGKTLPNIVIRNSFSSWENYLAALRSNYRRRLKKILTENIKIEMVKTPLSEFTHEMHRQYLEVYNRSKGKLEKFSFEFFRNLPSNFILTQCKREDELLGWNIALESDSTYYFFLGGIDYKYNKKYNTYFRLLAQIVKDGIERKVDLIDLGQTAETPKIRLGGQSKVLFMEARHSNKAINMLLKKFSKSLEYKVILEESHPFKTNSL